MISLLLADDHNIFRTGLKNLLSQEEDLEVIAETDDGADAVELAVSLVPNVAILDISMPTLTGIEAARGITSQSPATRVIILSMHTTKEYVSAALVAGASGFLSKSCTHTDLIQAIHDVVCGKHYLSPTISSSLIELITNPAAEPLPVPSKTDNQLSRRENEVLRLLAEGNCTKEVAARLGISAKTVESYRLNLMKKLNIVNMANLVRYAIREGIVDAD
ncbi:DNA-binding response regulator [Geomonas limicola]|uniref:DNA-binding response regulator n=1 Tax=Geomonas limicola TaxID=2740186 RepID=A0A6V8N8Y4_9BACT|nr:response regulator transcription factor [Geomonas limicola]GFO69046.1 DNA-binding response regulator [Geomonas limicola]